MTATIGDAVEHFTGGHAVAVDVQAIERDLAALWRASAQGERAVTRACMWTLVVHTVGDGGLARGQALAAAIAPACPARVLLLSRAEGDGVELEAWVSANCQLAPEGGKLLCSEEITVCWRGRGEDHLPALVEALRVPDVPAAVLWLGALDAPALLDRLAAGAERIIVDGCQPAQLAALAHRWGGRAQSEQLARRDARWGEARPAPPVEGGRAGAPLIDLSWLRLGPFRSLLASFFDPPVGAGPIRRAAQVRLEAAPVGRVSAQLLAGWLASRLDWGRPVPAGPGTWRVPRPGGAVALALVCRDGDAGRDGIYQVAITGDGGERFSISDAGAGTIELCGSGLPVRVLAAPERTDPELLIAALGTRGRDPLFAVALARATELVP